jgi:hypothetical protein
VNKRKSFYILIFLLAFGLMGGIILSMLESNSLRYLTKPRNSLKEASPGAFSNATVISDDETLWNDALSWRPSIAVDSQGTLHVVWEDNTDGLWGGGSSDSEIMYCNYTDAQGWSNATVISDDETLWNDGNSYTPEIDVDNSDNLHIVWKDATSGWWGSDGEIMYCNYTDAQGWSNATVISDDETLWNDGNSYSPDLAIDGSNNIHVVWHDTTDGWWGDDYEIMYCNYTEAQGWSNATVISDDETLWNNGTSFTPDIAIDNMDIIHVVWLDTTDGWWGDDDEIMYSTYAGTGWSNATIISDDETLWNDGNSYTPDLAIDGSNNIHVVWYDNTNGTWGIDQEIMYCYYTDAQGWSNATVISDDETLWNNYESMIPSIAIDSTDTAHVVWHDDTNGTWGIDQEIMYCYYTDAQGWSNATVISDDETLWNNGTSYRPDIAIDNMDTVHVVWHDDTNGTWGGGSTDEEIMYTIQESSTTSSPFPILIFLMGEEEQRILGYPIIIVESIAVISILSIIFFSRKKIIN